MPAPDRACGRRHRAGARSRAAAPRLVPLAAALAVAAAVVCTPVHAQGSAAPAPFTNSDIDSQLFFDLLVGEFEFRAGQGRDAFQTLLDAARRTRDEQLFRRAIEIAVQSRDGDQALAAVRAWRSAEPKSLEAVRTHVQVLSALNRLGEAAEPLRALLLATPTADRAGLIAVLPRFVQRTGDRALAARLVEDVTKPFADDPATRVPTLVAAGRVWAAAENDERALALVREAHAADPDAPGPVLLALEMMAKRPAAEAIVVQHLQRPQADSALRLAYARTLMGAQRLLESSAQIERVTKERPEFAPPFLTLGALHLELRHPQEAEAALKRYLELVQGAPTAAAADDDDDDAERSAEGVVQASLMLAQAAEQRGDYAAAEAWLMRVEDPKRALDVQTRRATLMARQGRLAEAREVLRRAPEREAGDARAKLVAEASLLRDVKRWGEAYDVLGSAAQAFPDDADLLYEQAMVAEKMSRIDDMERLLRRVIELKPESAHAHNALGYSLADRGQRLGEARDLVRRALELSPGDPFITDSLGWVEFRLGNVDEALRLLRQAYAARPDVEIGAHLGEVLWASGQRDDALRVWREASSRDAANEVLRETIARLKAGL